MINFDSACINNKDDLYTEIENIGNGKTNSFLDDKITWFLDEINQIDGVFTLFSCWGHKKYEYIGFKKYSNHLFYTEDQYPYLVISLDEKYINIFRNKIYQKIKDKYKTCSIKYIKNKIVLYKFKMILLDLKVEVSR